MWEVRILLTTQHTNRGSIPVSFARFIFLIWAFFFTFGSMSHKGIRLLIEKTARSLGDDIQFTYARASDFNQLRNKRYPFVSLGLMSASPSYSVNNVLNYMKNWSITMAFYELDNASSIQDEYSLILDSTDVLVDTFINRLNQVDLITLTSINQVPFVKDFSDILTGHILTFQLQVPDDWDYCADGC